MAVDQTLISGARYANAPDMSASYSAAAWQKGFQDVGDSLTSYIKNEKDKLNKTSDKYDNYVDNIVSGSELMGEELGFLHDHLTAGKQEYLDADDKGKAVIRQDLNKMYEDYSNFENLKDTMAGLNGDMSIAFTNSKQGEQIIDILSSPSKFMKTKNGRIGVEIDGEFKTVQELNRIVNSGVKDSNFEGVFNVLANKVAEDKIDQVEQEYPVNFDYIGTNRAIMSYVRKSKNLSSLVNDKLVAGKSFKESLLDQFDGQGLTYKQLGITDDMMGGALSDGKIDGKELENIIDNLLNEDNRDVLESAIGDWYTNLTGQEAGYTQSEILSSFDKFKPQEKVKTSGDASDNKTNTEFNSSTSENTLTDSEFLKTLTKEELSEYNRSRNKKQKLKNLREIKGQ